MINPHIVESLARLGSARRRAARTTNMLERLFGEERRRTKTIPHAFGERAPLRLMYAALIRASDSWRGVKVTEFETRQLSALREDLERAHRERVSPVSPNRPTKVSSKVRDLTGTNTANSGISN